MRDDYKTSRHSSIDDEPLPAFLARVRRMSSAGYLPNAIAADNLRAAQKDRTRKETELRASAVFDRKQKYNSFKFIIGRYGASGRDGR